jgi:hypothetical protein
MIEYIEKPKLVENAEIPDDEYPNITKYFANFYVREVLGGIKPKNGIAQADMMHFVRASSKTADFYKRHKGAELITEALEKSVSGDMHKLTPGWFSSDAMFDKRLPAFLFRQSLIEDRRDF